MKTAFRQILHLHVAKIGAGNTIIKKFMTFLIEREKMGVGMGLIGLGLLLFSIGLIRLIVFMATSEKKKQQMEWKMNEKY